MTWKAFSHCWPIYDPLQAKEFRVVTYKWLSELKGKGYLGSTIIRKSLLDDRQGERHTLLTMMLTIRYELLLMSLSSYILRLRLPKNYPESTRLALNPTPTDIESLRIHCLLHSYQLSRNARNRNQIHKQTQSFSRLLHEKDAKLSERERTCKRDLDVNLIFQQCQMEESRWEKNWTSIKNEWVLETLRKSLSSTPPIDFFSQSYQQAFSNYKPTSKKSSPTIIQTSSKNSETNITNLLVIEKELLEEISHLETTIPPEVKTPTHRKSPSSFRKSLPPTPLTTPSPSPEKSRMPNGSGSGGGGYNLRFVRSSSRLSTSSSESPRPMIRRMTSDHRISPLGNG